MTTPFQLLSRFTIKMRRRKKNWLLNSTFNSIITDQFRFAIKMVLELRAYQTLRKI